jgi:biopolymer transport protein ExbB/TolQ
MHESVETKDSDAPRVVEPVLSWGQADWEQRLGFRGGRFTSVNKVLSFCVALLLTIGFYAVVVFLLKPYPSTAYLAAMFLERGPCPYPTVLLSFWAVAILFLKGNKLAYQRRTLTLAAVPQEADFVLDRRTATDVLKRIRSLADDTNHFVLLKRIERALSNLRNIGNISDVSNILKTQAEYDEDQIASSYKLVTGFVWAIPVLGFIGTVLGLSQAIGSFGTVLRSSGDLSAIKDSLQGVTGGLATAFETTLIALIFALIIQLYMSHSQHAEAQFLDDCNDYCHAHVVAKLRLNETES